jgi:hypothetical protein
MTNKEKAQMTYDLLQERKANKVLLERKHTKEIDSYKIQCSRRVMKVHRKV